MTDREWSELMERSPKEARGAVAAEFGNLIYVIMLSKLHGTASHEDIKDCVSDVLVELFGSMEKYSPEKGSFKNFVTAVAKNTALNAFRRMSAQQVRSVSTDDEESSSPDLSLTPRMKSSGACRLRDCWR